MTRRNLVSIVLVILLLGGSVGAAGLLATSRPEAPRKDPAARVLLVRALPIEPRDVTERVRGFGTARADRRAQVSAQVAGLIVDLPRTLRAGATVKAKQLLVRVDSADYQQQLQRAQAAVALDEALLAQLEAELAALAGQVEVAQRELALEAAEEDRLKSLMGRQAAPEREVDRQSLAVERSRRVLLSLQREQSLLPSRRMQAQASLRSRQAEAQLAQLQLERCRILAPFDASVEAVTVEEGEQANVGRALVMLADLRLIEVPVRVALSLRDRVQVGAVATLREESRPGQVWSGVVTRIGVTASEQTRTFEAFVEVVNDGSAPTLPPGAFLTCEIAGPTFPNAVVIPREAILHGNRVFVATNGQSKPRVVTVVRQLEAEAIVEGLEPGEQLILSNLDRLEDGTPVRTDKP